VIDLFKVIASRHQDHPDNSHHITGLTGAAYILKCLAKGYSKNQIIHEKFEGDRQLVSTWIEFLKDKNWVVEKEKEEKEKDDDDVVDTNLKVTKKGKMWMNRFESIDN
jgi:FtsZ-binding cell division protein ZapB